ncbi:MAG: PEFG-CTERM sorting domain-containing protein [Nitrosarchaeum sp.]|nr:PEFG-CTERM sorting domain-containing protein [Nitrosarchaeum sp.]MCV0399070.1 PEFG-CTERM sorting domain-containing protein [Nitrosarchaeum sp.]
MSMVAFGLVGISAVLFVSGFGLTLSFAQTDSCFNCIQILPHNIELYQDLFPLTIWSDSYSYDRGSTVTIHGHLRPENTVSPVLIVVTSPIGNVITVEQISPKKTGDFSFTLNTNSPLWKQDGEYVIKAQSGADTRQFKTKFNLVSFGVDNVNKCTAQDIPIIADDGKSYCLPFKSEKGTALNADGTLSISSKTLALKIRGSNADSITLDIPRYLLDSKSSSGNDSDFIVMSGGNIVEFERLSSDADSRQIKISYDPTKSRSYQIVGTHVVPEFGPVMMIILFGSIGLILFFNRTFSNRFVKF